MTESDLLAFIETGTGKPAVAGHPAYCDAGTPVHPTEPIDYDETRLLAAEKVLGESDFTYHPALGTPHVDIHRYPATAERPFTCYLTSGMSDFKIRLRDGRPQRVELVACTAKPDKNPDINSPSSITQVIRYVSIYPFIQQLGIYYYHVVELPEQYQPQWGKRLLLIPPFLLKELAFLPLMDEKISVLGMIRITDGDFNILLSKGPEALFNSWRETLETWLFDTSERERNLPAPRPEPSSLIARIFRRKNV